MKHTKRVLPVLLALLLILQAAPQAYAAESGPAAAALLLFSLSLPVLQPKENIPS